MATNTPLLFVAGATGAVGRVLLREAEARGVEVRPQVRPASAAKLGHPRQIALELDDPALARALEGCSTVVQLIGTMKKRFASGDTYETSDIGTTGQLVEAAKRAGVRHFILLSSVGAGRPIGAYLHAKARAEALVRESGIPFTIFRPSAFEDRDGGRMRATRALTKLLGLSTFQPIRLEELARALVHVAAMGAPTGVALEGKPLWNLVLESEHL